MNKPKEHRPIKYLCARCGLRVIPLDAYYEDGTQAWKHCASWRRKGCGREPQVMRSIATHAAMNKLWKRRA